MGETVELSSWSDRKSTGLCASIVLKALGRMTRGRLTLVLPNGERSIIGDGKGIHAQIEIKRYAFFTKCVLYGDIGFGEAFVDGDWESDSVTAVISWFLLNIDQSPTISGSRRQWSPVNLLKGVNRIFHLVRPNSRSVARRNIASHYDLSNAFFRIFLDESMTYSSAYFEKDGMALEEAQAAKYERLCQQLNLRETDRVLEIGSGWGSFAIHAARKYGCSITTITISKAQYELARQRVDEAGVADRVTVELQDYRNVEGLFDKIVSIEMLEAVGHRYLRDYFAQCHRLLAPHGRLALQVITCPDHRYDDLRRNVDWIQKHIFPGSLLPSLAAIHQAVNQTGEMNFIDIKDMGSHYARTLLLWRNKFNHHLARIKSLGFDQRFIRMWNYYLSYCEGAFRMNNISVVQMTFSRPNVPVSA